MAKEMGIAEGYLGGIFARKRRGSMSFLTKMAQYLNVPLPELMQVLDSDD